MAWGASGSIGARVPDRWWTAAIGGMFLAAVFVAVLLVQAGGDQSLLVHAGPPWTSRVGAPSSLTVQPADEAFDGQFFYRLGVAPWSEERAVNGVTFDLPALRNARWGYGALAFAASAGQSSLVPWALIGLNVVAAGAVGAMGGLLARTSGRHALWGVVFVLWPGFAYSLSLDTSELVAGAFVLAGLWAAREARWLVATAALSAAVLTRDTTVIVAAGLTAAGAWGWWQTRRRIGDAGRVASAAASHQLLTGMVALAVFGLWQVLQRVRFGEWPLTSSGDNNLAAPFTGLLDQLGQLLPPDGGDAAFRLVSAVALLGLLALAFAVCRRSTAPLGEKLGLVAGALVVALLNAYLWSGATAFMRAGTEAALLAVAVILGGRHRFAAELAAIGLAGVWLLTAGAQVVKLG
jgi:hypothetical protein